MKRDLGIFAPGRPVPCRVRIGLKPIPAGTAKRIPHPLAFQQAGGVHRLLRPDGVQGFGQYGFGPSARPSVGRLLRRVRRWEPFLIVSSIKQ